MDQATTIAVVENAFRAFLKEQATIELLKRGRVERTFATDLANHLKATFEFDGVRVDSPYNRHHGATKRLNDRVIELDIAIHERGIDERNLVAIELETNNRPKRDDLWKLEGLTNALGGYGYRLGLYLAVGISERAGEVLAAEWYCDGKRL